MSVSALSPMMISTALLATLSWIGFIVAGFVLWSFGNTNGGYSMVGIAIILPAVVAALLLVHALCARKGFSEALVSTLGWLGSLSWSGFLVAGFMLWYYGNTNGGYAMVGIAIILPAVVAVALTFTGACATKALPAPAAVTVDAASSAAAPAPVPAPAPAVTTDAGVTV